MFDIVFILVGLCVILLMKLCYIIGHMKGKQDCIPYIDMANRFKSAVDDLDRWCSHDFICVRLITKHLNACGLGHGLNAGTPVTDEPCTINGLREQLRRINNCHSNQINRQFCQRADECNR